MTVTVEQLAEWDRLASEATSGPWTDGEGFGYFCVSTQGEACFGSCGCCVEPMSQLDAAFIAAARTAVPALIARVRELEWELATLKDAASQGRVL